MHRKGIKQLLHRGRHIVARKKMKNVLPYLLGAQEVQAHKGNIRLKCAWNRAERRDKNDGTIVHRTARNALGNTAQTRDNRRRFEFPCHIFEHENLTRKILLPQHRGERSAEIRRIAAALLHIAAVHTPRDNAAPLFLGNIRKDVLYFPVLKCVNIENRQSSIHILFKFLAEYRLVSHDVPSFLIHAD